MRQSDPHAERPGHSGVAGPAVAPSKQQRKPLPKTMMFGAAGLILGILLGIAGTVTVTSALNTASAKAAAEAEANKPRPLPEALTKCKLTAKKTVAKLGDDGHSLSLDGVGEEDASGLPMADIDCVLEAVDMPDSIRDQMGNTRALDGTQRDNWKNFSVSWNYHPNSGLNVNLKEDDR